MHTAWDERGFLAEMTRRMMDAVQHGASGTPAPHMRWGIPGEAEARLPGFGGEMLEALRGHLEESAGADGAVEAFAGYVLVSGERAR